MYAFAKAPTSLEILSYDLDCLTNELVAVILDGNYYTLNNVIITICEQDCSFEQHILNKFSDFTVSKKGKLHYR